MMLSPKEKAKELVSSMLQYQPLSTHERTEEMNVNFAKECALIAVNEIMKAVGWKKMKLGVNRDSYWDEVKTEIEKL